MDGINSLMDGWSNGDFEVLEKYYKDGLPEAHIINLIGVKENTFYFWKKRAREILLLLEENPDYKLGDGEKRVIRFHEICKKGKSEAVAKNLEYIQDAAKSSWQAAAWYLERVDRENFGKKQDINFNGVVATGDIDLTEEEKKQFKNNLSSFFGSSDGSDS